MPPERGQGPLMAEVWGPMSGSESPAAILLKSPGASNLNRDDLSRRGLAGDGTTIVAAAGQSQCPERVLAFGWGTAGNSLSTGPGSEAASIWRGLRSRSWKIQP